MCGIFGYVGTDDHSIKKALSGLKDLEYRGYDSWGLLAQADGKFFVKKDVGKVGKVNEKDFNKVLGTLSIGHSRWATHGGVTIKNAHPHLSNDGRFAVVHNGIVENVPLLKRRLKGVKFVSETDTEVIPQLIAYYVRKGKSVEQAFFQVARELEGRFAFLLVPLGEEKIYAARRGSPLIVGKGEGEYFIASDIPAFLDYTNTVNYLDDGEAVIIDKSGLDFRNIESGKQINKRDVKIEWGKETVKKGEYDHFMLKEILEQKETLVRATQQDEREIIKAAKLIMKSKRVLLIGCGTAGNVCQTARYFFTGIANKQVSFVPASEFDLYERFLGRDTLLLAVSQSGETADVLEAVTRAKKAGAKILSVVNVKGSSLERASTYSFLIKAGPEIAVASTKATSSQLATLFQLAYAARGELKKGEQLVLDTARALSAWLNPRFLEHVKRIAKELSKHDHIYCIGRSHNFPIALEAALKIQEISYIHAEGFAGGEIKHGPIALIGQGTPVLAFVHEGEGREDILTNIAELKARGAFVVAVAREKLPIFDEWLSIPGGENVAPIVSLIPAQLLAYYLALEKGNDPDKPRNLAKSVTVK